MRPRLAGLIGILNTHEFDKQRYYAWTTPDPAARGPSRIRCASSGKKRDSIPLVERWYRTLLDDAAGSARWLEAAGGIIQREGDQFNPQREPDTLPMKGEPLRVGRDPSVTTLLLRRARQIEPRQISRTSYDREFAAACQMGSILASWDPHAALPLLKDLMKGCRVRSDLWLDQENPANPDRNLASYLAQFTEIRVKLGDLGALDEYASWLRTTTPKMLEYGMFDALPPLFAHSDHPALASAAHWLFNDPKSPWVPLLPEARGQQSPPFKSLFESPLIAIAGFRAGVLAGLADKTPLGTLERKSDGSIERKIKNVPTVNYGTFNAELEGVAVGVEYPFRRCDLLASQLSAVEGSPRFNLFWPETSRDEAVAAFISYLKRFGPVFTAEKLPGVMDIPNRKPHLKFPTLGRPATAEDVAANRAIFSLEGRGETRLVSLPGFPQSAEWLTLKDSPVDLTDQDGVTRREYDTDGYVWQAEEVRKGDAGNGSTALSATTSSRERRPPRSSSAACTVPRGNSRGAWSPRRVLVDPRKTAYQPGQPIVVTLRLQNRSGVDRSSPTEFVRPGPDGKPALRQGVNLSLWRSTKRPRRVLNSPGASPMTRWRPGAISTSNLATQPDR